MVKLDLGCGLSKREGFHGVDICALDGVGTVLDLFKFPWPWESESIEEVNCSHFFEHVPGLLRYQFMAELYRILQPNAKVTFITPYYKSPRASMDPTHKWPPISEESYLYFNRKWLAENKLTHCQGEFYSDFDFTYGYGMNSPWTAREDSARSFAIQHYWNVVADLHVTLTKRPRA